DLRIAILAVLFIILFQRRLDILKDLSLVIIPVVLLDAFWEIPLIQTSQSASLLSQSLNTTSFIDSLTLFQSNFPLDEFGKTFPVPSYYRLLPILLLIGAWSQKKIISLFGLFIVFAFLAKGGSDPFGQIYNFLVTKLPL